MKVTVLLFAACIIAVAFGALLRPKVFGFGDGSDPVGLRVTHLGNDFDISWDRSSRMLQSARRGRLLIDDGSAVRTLELDPATLREGHVVYTPIRPDLSVRLEVITADQKTNTASVVILGGPQNKVEPLRAPSAVSSRPTPVRTYVPAIEERSRSVEERSRPLPFNKQFRPPAAGPPAVPSNASPMLSAPEVAAVPSMSADALKPGALPTMAPPPSASAGPPPRYVDPVAVRRPGIQIPMMVRGALSGRVVIVAKVTVGRDGVVGKVKNISIEGNPGPYIAELRQAALTTIRQFVFRPATLNGAPVETEHTIQFVIAE